MCSTPKEPAKESSEAMQTATSILRYAACRAEEKQRRTEGGREEEGGVTVNVSEREGS